MKKVLSIITALALATSLIISGCGKKENPELPSDTVLEAELPEGIAALVGDYEVTQEEFDFYLESIVYNVQNYFGSDAGWENQIIDDGITAGEYILNAVKDMIQAYGIFKQKTNELGIYSDAERKEYIQREIELSGGEEAFEEMIKTMGLSREAAESILTADGAYEALTKYYCSEEAAEKIFSDDYVRAKHILFLFDSSDSDEDATLAKANKAYERAMGGESFEDLIDELNEDPGEDTETGYVFTEGEMVEEFYNGTLALGEGEISEPVKTVYGYHVIKRYPLPEKGSDSYDSYVQQIMSRQGSEEVDSALEEWKKEYPLTVSSSVFSSIDFSKYVSNVNTADGSVFND